MVTSVKCTPWSCTFCCICIMHECLRSYVGSSTNLCTRRAYVKNPDFVTNWFTYGWNTSLLLLTVEQFLCLLRDSLANQMHQHSHWYSYLKVWRVGCWIGLTMWSVDRVRQRSTSWSHFELRSPWYTVIKRMMDGPFWMTFGTKSWMIRCMQSSSAAITALIYHQNETFWQHFEW